MTLTWHIREKLIFMLIFFISVFGISCDNGIDPWDEYDSPPTYEELLAEAKKLPVMPEYMLEGRSSWVNRIKLGWNDYLGEYRETYTRYYHFSTDNKLGYTRKKYLYGIELEYDEVRLDYEWRKIAATYEHKLENGSLWRPLDLRIKDYNTIIEISGEGQNYSIFTRI